MKNWIVFLICIVCISSCAKNSVSVETPINTIPSQTSTSDNSVDESAVNSNHDSVASTGIQIFKEQNTTEELLSEVNIMSYDVKHKDRHDNLMQTSWYRIEPNRDIVNEKTDNILSEIVPDGIYSKYFPAINNSIPLENGLTQCGVETLISMNDISIFSIYSTTNYPETWGQRQYPIVFLRQTSPGNYYTVYKLNNGGWVYMFYSPWPHETDVGGVYSYCEDLTHITCMGGVYIENVLSYSDFESIKVGDSIDKVKVIDSCVDVYQLAHECNGYAPATRYSKEYVGKYMESRHMLTDGLLKIVYKKVLGNWVVCEIDYSEDYIYTSSFYPWYWEQIDFTPNAVFTKQFKILEQDYPPVD